MNDKYLPGERVCDDSEYIRGHGTQRVDDSIVSSVYGAPRIINKLISVIPFNTFRYTAEVGDVVVGRIVEVGDKKWRVDLNCRTEVTLHLSAINLPGEVQRRKMESDEMKMREYFAVGDVVVAEVQKVNKSGSVALHTRNEKYRRLSYGVLVDLPPMLVPRIKSYFIGGCDVEIAVGANGYIFIGAVVGHASSYKKVAAIYQYFEGCKKHMVQVDYATIVDLVG